MELLTTHYSSVKNLVLKLIKNVNNFLSNVVVLLQWKFLDF